MEKLSLFRWTKLAITLRSFAKSFIFLKFLLKWGSITTSNPNPDIQRQTFLKTYCQRFDLELIDKDLSLPAMCWLPKLHKTPIGTKPLSGVISIIFKMIFKHDDSFHNKSTFYSSYKKFWVVENSFPII